MGGDRCREQGEDEIEQGKGLVKVPPTMLVLLALPLLAVSARGQVEDRSLLEDIIDDLERQQQYPDYQYSDQMYDAEPSAPARALHQDDLRAANRQGKQIKSSMLPAYCDPPNPCPIGYTAQDGCIEDLKTTLNSHKSIRLLKTACVIPNTCLHVPSQNSRTEEFPSLGVSPLLRKSRTPTSLGQSCPSQPRRGWATRSSSST